jgi:hypothetical protein
MVHHGTNTANYEVIMRAKSTIYLKLAVTLGARSGTITAPEIEAIVKDALANVKAIGEQHAIDACYVDTYGHKHYISFNAATGEVKPINIKYATPDDD